MSTLSALPARTHEVTRQATNGVKHASQMKHASEAHKGVTGTPAVTHAVHQRLHMRYTSGYTSG